MARPKGKLFALLAVFAAIGLVAASGAFTSVSAERTVTVDTAGDASANLAFDDSTSTYATVSSDQLTLDYNDVNIDADTDFGETFTITNNGPNEVTLYIADESGEVPADFSADSPLNDDSISFTASGSNIEDSTNATTVSAGGSVTVSTEISFGDVGTGNQLDGSIVIVAESTP